MVIVVIIWEYEGSRLDQYSSWLLSLTYLVERANDERLHSAVICTCV